MFFYSVPYKRETFIHQSVNIYQLNTDIQCLQHIKLGDEVMPENDCGKLKISKIIQDHLYKNEIVGV